jgi:hypothetical protein
MDVHDLARALCRRIGASHPLHQWEEIAVAYELAIRAFPHLRPALEAHTRAAVEAAEARIVAWTEAEAAEFLKSPKDSLEFFHGESLLELVRCYRDGEHRRPPKEGVMKWNDPATTGDMWALPLAIAAAFLIGALFA